MRVSARRAPRRPCRTEIPPQTRRAFGSTAIARKDARIPTDSRESAPEGDNTRREGADGTKKSFGDLLAGLFKNDSENPSDADLAGTNEKIKSLADMLERTNQLLERMTRRRRGASIPHLVREDDLDLPEWGNKMQTFITRFEQDADKMSGASSEDTNPQRRGRRRNAVQRSQQTTKEPSSLKLPDWFYTRNLKLHGSKHIDQNYFPGNDHRVGQEELRTWAASFHKGPHHEIVDQQFVGMFTASTEPVPGFSAPTYALDFEPFVEIYASIAASFSLARRGAESGIASPKTDFALYCPKGGTILLLRSIIDSIATRLEADIVRLDAQDLAALGTYNSHHLETSDDLQKLASVGFATYENSAESPEQETSTEDVDEEEGEEPQVIGIGIPGDKPTRNLTKLLGLQGHLRRLSERVFTLEQGPKNGLSLDEFLEHLLNTIHTPRSANKILEAPSQVVPSAQTLRSEDSDRLSPSETTDLNFEPPNHDRQQPSMYAGNRNTHKAIKPQQRKLIIILEDFQTLSGTQIGENIVRALTNVVHSRRKQFKQEITIIGTSAMSDRGDTADLARQLHDAHESSMFYPMIVTPLEVEEPPSLGMIRVTAPAAPPPITIWDHLNSNRIESINFRNLRDMLKRLMPLEVSTNLSKNLPILPNHLTDYYHWREHVLGEQKIHEIVMAAIGLHEISGGELNMNDIHHAMWLLQRSTCLQALQLRQSDLSESLQASSDQPNAAAKARLEKLKVRCSRHEKQLFGGIVQPERIKVGFGDVHVSTDTVEALKSTTSLSLTRPDAFKYGILESDSLPGLLMYGPPGTGKTMLARAVAKDSGATVLNISGSEVRQMFVGESEKIVKAIFSLAQKLSPCVIFIDEADSLLGTRSMRESGNRSHRDTINQFLLEWDGMSERNVFLMVATNRPFDLDDAVLRRLPRRLLVDLPMKQDREAILSIHLKGESLDESVSLADLAEKTPFYSGSDLKNVAVSAALACVKDENEMVANAKAEGSKDAKYPEKRILTKQHFEKALGDIAASATEDMPTLVAIRKFDEQYGDRKGRRKKTSWGFIREEVKETNMRVRN
jgi:hypothetical protein